MANKLVGQNYTTPDLVAKVTGKAKYAEDFRADGMLFAKLLCSPMPHARVVRIDTTAALAMPGVKAILTVYDLPAVVEGANLGEGIIASGAGGYVVDPERVRIDSRRFEELIDDALRADGDGRVVRLDEALALWRGSAFGEFRGLSALPIPHECGDVLLGDRILR